MVSVRRVQPETRVPFPAFEAYDRSTMITLKVELEKEVDARWVAEVLDLPGVVAYGATPEEAKAKVQALALRVVADRLEHGEEDPDLLSISFAAA